MQKIKSRIDGLLHSRIKEDKLAEVQWLNLAFISFKCKQLKGAQETKELFCHSAATHVHFLHSSILILQLCHSM